MHVFGVDAVAWTCTIVVRSLHAHTLECAVNFFVDALNVVNL